MCVTGFGDRRAACHDLGMTSRTSDHVSGRPTSGKVEVQFRGSFDTLMTLRTLLEDAGVYVQLDHQYTNHVWGQEDVITLGALMVPAPTRAEVRSL